jgi:hypothetical protein
MFKRVHFILAITVVFGLVNCVLLNAESSVVETYKKQEKQLSKKRFEQKKWSGGQQSDLTQKAFPFKHWNKNYSSMGSKKWDYSLEKTSDKKRFKTGMVEFSTKDIKISEWQGYLANLESRAQISTDTTARIIQDKRTYEMMLQQANNYKDTGETVSLRDINRFQFRKNRSDGDVPATKAGSGDETQ